MYSESDLQSAVAAGAITAQTADALRDHVAKLRPLPFADEENVRLVTGFNDIFVTIACALVVFSAIYVGSDTQAWVGGVLVAVSSWLMAEVFTRRRRMALPSITLLVALVVGAGIAGGDAVELLMPKHGIEHSYHYNGQTTVWTEWVHYPWQEALMALTGAMVAGLCALAHWLRFRVAITIAAGVGAVVLTLLAGLAAATGYELKSNPVIAPAALFCGVAVFSLAMRWDLSDRERRTQRADIAFWLHLLAAPLLAHPLFYWMGVLNAQQITLASGLGVLTVYFVFALIALAVDRRALLVSALAYVIAALYGLLHEFGTVSSAMALTTLLIGSALLALSIFWAPLRRLFVHLLPPAWQQKLPITT
jgi:hypothetical protein